MPDGGVRAERLLLRELAHRTDDELALAIDLVTKAIDGCDGAEVRAALASVQDRLENHARLHHALQMPQFTTTVDLAAYLQQLCRSISRSSLEGEGIALSLLVQPLKIDSERCWLLGMIVFELITSAARHVSHSEAGEIRLELWGTATSISCCITDNGFSGESRFREEDRSIVETFVAHLGGMVDVCGGVDGGRTVVNVPR
ncbi:sensor histidine kinase [Bradyrhizobium liaoningense]|uniref:histidine kinase dimerization/phosphoacceptor domain -containing protein n=1 Tax=Bradyrhizobium liaoningense TaxID=43992 RepID=UPI001BA6A4B8|nr:histidine kinase dimerization/phosphoacceptor domain -containing protein [Bradyrhizobium liaoningense]MBR0845755.1 sensor histidine kinase [Bradyrhizobium liaoningense]MBR0859945.1 sensor histidine kinase [Bradyrhizobium liaoningense]